MGVSELRSEIAGGRCPRPGIPSTGSDRKAPISARDMARARLVQGACDTTIDRVLTAEGLVRRQDVLEAHARRARSRQLTTPDLAGLRPPVRPRRRICCAMRCCR